MTDAPREDASTAWIDWAKVVAISGVVIVHVSGHAATVEGARGTMVGKFAIVSNSFATFAVPLFVMISGLLLLDEARDRDDGQFLKRRAWRLVPALVFWHIFYFAFRRWYLDQESLSAVEYLRWTLNGRAFQALYYFWVILGLAIVTPVVRPWVQQATRRAVLVAGLGFAALPVLTVATYRFRGASVTWVETPWTWFFFYLGYYVLGYGLRDVVMPAWALLATAPVAGGIVYVMADNWNTPTASPPLVDWFGRSYYHFGTLVLTTWLFVTLHSCIRPGGAFRALSSGSAARLAALLGGATLGVYALHTAMWWWLVDAPVLGSDRAAASIIELVARFVAVLGLTYAVVLPLRRVPVVRRVL